MNELSHIPSEFSKEFSVDAKGKVTASRRAIARLAGVEHTSIARLLAKLPTGAPNGSRYLEPFAGMQLGESIPLELICGILGYYGHEAGRYTSKQAAYLFTLMPRDSIVAIDFRTQAKKKKSKPEAIVRDRLAKKLNGEKEVVTPSGNIDVLTSSEVIEVKIVKDWKAALGQVLAYGYYYPSHSRRIHLFGTAHSKSKEEINLVCKSLNVHVTWEDQ
jgi:hypothetical protein